MRSKKQIIVILLFCISVFNLDAQSQNINISPLSTKVWAGEIVEYTRQTSITGCVEYNWSPFLGTLPDFQNSTSAWIDVNKVKVKWDMASSGSTGALDIYCGGATGAVSNIAILSLINKNIGSITSGGQSSLAIQYCDISPLTFKISTVPIPNAQLPGGTPKIASGYEWTIPPGWVGPSGQTGTFLINNSTGNSIKLTPNGCAGGQIIVRAFTDTEGKGTPHYSEYSSPFTITRQLPEIGTSTTTYKCSEPFTASISPLTCATGNYSWSVPPGWQIQGSGTSVTIIPNNASGNILVTANLTGGSCSPQTVSKSITIENDIQPIIGQDNGGCGTTFSAGTLPPGSSISWTYSSNLQRINSGSSPSLQVVPTNPSSYAPGWVKAYVTNPNGCDFEKTRTIWVGIPGLPSTSFQSFNVYGGGTFSAPSFAGSTTGYTWTVSSSLTVVSGGGVNDNTITVSINPNQTYGDIFVRARNSCGSSQQPSQIRVNRIQSFNYSAYPNPVINELTIEAEKIDTTSRELQPFEVKIYDETGNEIFTRKMEDAKNKISVNGFKGGFYYLHIISEEGIIRKKIKIEK